MIFCPKKCLWNGIIKIFICFNTNISVKKKRLSRAPLFNMGKNTGTDFRLFPICLLRFLCFMNY